MPGVPHIDAIDVVNAGPVMGLGFYLDLPGPAKQINIIDEVAAERGLQGLKDGV